jgi:hypothetical protein
MRSGRDCACLEPVILKKEYWEGREEHEKTAGFGVDRKMELVQDRIL